MSKPLSFSDLLQKRRGIDFHPPERLLALDPGETTGWVLFINGLPADHGEIRTAEGGWKSIDSLFSQLNPTMVIYENYRVYEHKLSRHSNSEVYTLRLIGVIEYLCEVLWGIPYHNQMAQQAKGFVTDEKLKTWGFYVKGARHSRDAFRHACYFLLFDKNL